MPDPVPGVVPEITHRHGVYGRFHTHKLSDFQANPDIKFGEEEIILGSGFRVGGVLTIGYDGGNHPLEGEVLACQSCGMLLLPEDQRIHEGLHDKIDNPMFVLAPGNQVFTLGGNPVDDTVSMTPEQARQGFGVHRLLATSADPERMMLLQLDTNAYANWIEARRGERGTTWLVTCFNPDFTTFLQKASAHGVTLEEICTQGGDETYVLLYGREGTGWQPATGHREVRMSVLLPWELFEGLNVTGLEQARARPGEPVAIGVLNSEGDVIPFTMTGPEDEHLAPWKQDARFESAVADPGGKGLAVTLSMAGWEPPGAPWPSVPGLRTGSDIQPG